MAKTFRIQLYDARTGQRITGSGGALQVVTAGAYDKVSLEDADGNTLANPLSLSSGFVEFFTDDAVTTVDVYGVAPDGQAFYDTLENAEDHVITIDRAEPYQLLRIPFDIDDTDTSDATEEDTGFDEPANAYFLPNPFIVVGTADATEDIDVGTSSGESGDANGFMDGVSLANTGLATARNALTVGSNETFLASTTLGALLQTFLAGSDAATDVGTAEKHGHESTEKSITFTLSSGTNTGAGLICLPYLLHA